MLTGAIKEEDITSYNEKYKKVIIPCNTMIEDGQKGENIYVQFKLSRDQVAKILQDKTEGQPADVLLDNVAEINSYSIFDKETGEIYAGVDMNSNPGNCNPEDNKTYENDTSSAPGLRLEVVNARQMTGKVFIDNHEVKDKEDSSGIMSGMKRQGNGKYDDGEAVVNEVEVILTETSGSSQKYTAKTTGNGDFLIENYIPGDYTLTYTWGGQTYKIGDKEQKITVQNYKGTVYDQERYNANMANSKWWYVARGEDGTKEKAIKWTDAVDNYSTDQNAPKGSRTQIDDEMKTVNKDTNTKITREKMDSTTPIMDIGVGYDSAFTDVPLDTEKFKNKFIYKIEDIDFGIIERPKQALALDKRITSMKVTLANGQVIADLKVDGEGNISGEKNGITYMKPSPTTSPQNGFIRLELDNELIQGTKLEVGYEIKATNISELDYISEDFYKYGKEVGELVKIKPTGIMDYLDKNWAFDLANNGQISEVKTNVDAIKDFVKEEVITDQDSTIAEKMILYTNHLANTELDPTKDHNIGIITFNVSKLLTTTDEISLDNETEVVEVQKTGGANLQSVPGNYIPGKGITELDDSMAETTIVTPATGEDQNYIIPIVIGVSALLILGVGVVIIKKKAI